MASITIQLHDKALESLKMIAKEQGLSPEKYASDALSKAIGYEDVEDANDSEVDEIMKEVLNKNKELYKRLA